MILRFIANATECYFALAVTHGNVNVDVEHGKDAWFPFHSVREKKILFYFSPSVSTEKCISYASGLSNYYYYSILKQTSEDPLVL